MCGGVCVCVQECVHDVGRVPFRAGSVDCSGITLVELFAVCGVCEQVDGTGTGVKSDELSSIHINVLLCCGMSAFSILAC